MASSSAEPRTEMSLFKLKNEAMPGEVKFDTAGNCLLTARVPKATEAGVDWCLNELYYNRKTFPAVEALLKKVRQLQQQYRARRASASTKSISAEPSKVSSCPASDEVSSCQTSDESIDSDIFGILQGDGAPRETVGLATKVRIDGWHSEDGPGIGLEPVLIDVFTGMEERGVDNWHSEDGSGIVLEPLPNDVFTSIEEKGIASRFEVFRGWRSEFHGWCSEGDARARGAYSFEAPVDLASVEPCLLKGLLGRKLRSRSLIGAQADSEWSPHQWTLDSDEESTDVGSCETFRRRVGRSHTLP